VEVFTQGIRCTSRQRGQLGQRLGRPGRVGQIAPLYAWEALQVGDDRGAQFCQQVIEGRTGVRRNQECLDGVSSDRLARAWVKGTTSLAEKPMSGS